MRPSRHTYRAPFPSERPTSNRELPRELFPPSRFRRPRLPLERLRSSAPFLRILRLRWTDLSRVPLPRGRSSTKPPSAWLRFRFPLDIRDARTPTSRLRTVRFGRRATSARAGPTTRLPTSYPHVLLRPATVTPPIAQPSFEAFTSGDETTISFPRSLLRPRWRQPEPKLEGYDTRNSSSKAESRTIG